MTMTDTEAKALALVNEFRAKCAEPTLPVTMSHVWAYGAAWEALCRVIKREAAAEARHAAELREQAERFDAFRQEVSDVLEDVRDNTTYDVHPKLWRFITPKPKPDPLVELAQEAFSAMLRANSPDGLTEALRAVMQARGYEVRKIEHTPPAGGSDEQE